MAMFMDNTMYITMQSDCVSSLKDSDFVLGT